MADINSIPGKEGYNNITYGFNVLTDRAIDSRFVLSFAEMRTVDDGVMPDVYFTVCADDGKLYVYNKTNTVLGDTGKFRLVDECPVKDVQLNGVSKLNPETKIANIEVPFKIVDNKLCCVYDDSI